MWIGFIQLFLCLRIAYILESLKGSENLTAGKVLLIDVLVEKSGKARMYGLLQASGDPSPQHAPNQHPSFLYVSAYTPMMLRTQMSLVLTKETKLRS